MSLHDLQAWLLAEGIASGLATLTREIALTELDGVLPAEVPTNGTPVDWRRMILAGSILAASEEREFQEAALRIATAAVTLPNDSAVRDAGAVLMGKLANLRSVALAQERRLLDETMETRLGVSLRLETQRRRSDLSVLIQSSGQWLPVNTFQSRFWHVADNSRWLSASAPTASGKTYLVLQWLLEQVRGGDARIAVYLAPTRALVSEIESYLVALLGKEAGIRVSSLPLRSTLESARSGGDRLILVFTQERLHLFANVSAELFTADLLIVDEAHKIGDYQRGTVLQDAIERAQRANSSLRVVFISPATKNPEELLADAPEGTVVAAVNSDTPTVVQNVFLAEQVPRKPKLWRLSIQHKGGAQPVGIVSLPHSPSGVKKRLAFIAATVGERGGTLVYTNRPSEAEEVALLISQLIPDHVLPDPELAALADLARRGVHRKYALGPLVERGVAFHYGNMPSLIRQEIERLFRSGKIRFLVCTSTLVEGVNLSCRTIVMRGPKKGLGRPMQPHDFWNLAGRAGRWGNEFQGNIICIDPNDRKAWPGGVPQRERYPIRRESDDLISRGNELAAYLAARLDAGNDALESAGNFESVGAYLLSTFLRVGSLNGTTLARRHSPDAIAALDRQLQSISEGIEIDANVAGRHPGVSAIGMQRLLTAFREYKGDVENLLPAPADSHDSYDRFVTIMERINQHVFPAFVPEGRVPLHALVMTQWLKGLSLARIIDENINYHKQHKKKYSLPALIRDTMELVEQVARFRAPKYMSAYIDILNIHLRSIGRNDLIDNDVDIGIQLEFGVSSRTLLSLLELGLSRMSAVVLYDKIAQDDLSKDGCIAWVERQNRHLDGMDFPQIILREIRDKMLPKTTS